MLLTRIQNSLQKVYLLQPVAHLKYIKYLHVKFTCLRYAHILFNVSKMFTVNGILGFCFT